MTEKDPELQKLEEELRLKKIKAVPEKHLSSFTDEVMQQIHSEPKKTQVFKTLFSIPKFTLPVGVGALACLLLVFWVNVINPTKPIANGSHSIQMQLAQNEDLTLLEELLLLDEFDDEELLEAELGEFDLETA